MFPALQYFLVHNTVNVFEKNINFDICFYILSLSVGICFVVLFFSMLFCFLNCFDLFFLSCVSMLREKNKQILKIDPLKF